MFEMVLETKFSDAIPGDQTPSPPSTLAGSAWPNLRQLLDACWRRMHCLGHRPARRLRLCESLPLGERRFVAVVEFEQFRFLVGGTSASLVLLAQLQGSPKDIPGPQPNLRTSASGEGPR